MTAIRTVIRINIYFMGPTADLVVERVRFYGFVAVVILKG